MQDLNCHWEVRKETYLAHLKQFSDFFAYFVMQVINAAEGK